MSNIKSILKFDFDFHNFLKASEKVISIQIQSQIGLRILELNKITEQIGVLSFEFKDTELIPGICRKFKSSILNNNIGFDRRELRTLTYALSYSENQQKSIFGNEIELNYALQLLNSNWQASFLIGIIDCYLKNWEADNKNSLFKLIDFISNKLIEYNGNRTTLKAFKSNLKYFDLRNGDLVLGNELALKNKPIKDATKHLSLPETWFAYPYFSKVIVAYYDKKQSELPNLIDDFENALDFHKNTNTNKRIVSKFINQANNPQYESLQERVKSIAFNFIGDPENKGVWADFENATEKEKAELRNARIILNEWITRQFINVFFNVCINDDRRKRFWLKYSKEIKQFRVVGSTYIKRLLLSDDRINEYVAARFSNTNSTRDSNSALMFIMKNHLFIEFSDDGAFYAYKLSNPNAPSIENDSFFSTGSLKNTSFDWLAYRTGRTIYRMNDEGRLGHNDGDLTWEEVAYYWIKNKAEINV